MNKYSFLVLALALGACSSEKGSQEGNEKAFDFTYTVDTVMVDPGDHFIYLQQNLGSSDITPDGKYLLNFNAKTMEMEIVDLDELKLSSVVKLEQEGPNGIGTSPYFGAYRALSKDEFMFASQNKVIKMDLTTNQATYYSFKRSDLSPDALAANEELKNGGLLSSDGSTFYSWYGIQEKPYENHGLAKIDLGSLEVKAIPIPQMDKLDQFTIEVAMSDGTGMRGKFGENITLLELEDKIIIQQSAFNEFWVLDKATLEVTVKANKSNLTENVKAGNFANKVTSQDAFKEARNARDKEVSFGNLILDSERNMIWRISSDFDHMDGEKMVRNYYLTFFDLDLNQLGEYQLENWKMAGKPFIKDGDFYQFLNLDDDMAFVRLKPNFGND
ncbi:DUF4221 family protein [Algoriphagus aquimarinus]|uniref:DUF4221 family protein n=1 Tax=Algoriphagus aquimarinus TaxID=237018 RepID=UPI0030DC5914|tara:strand:+ start:13177 stop:14334 length:1158 start_codon:yes stop_codon:yes gene_type:complete